MVLNANKSTRDMTSLTTDILQDIIDNAIVISRGNVDEYLLLVNRVLNMSSRRSMVTALRKCESYCFKDDDDNVNGKILTEIDKTVSNAANIEEIPYFSDIADELLESLMKGSCGIPSKFPMVNEYFTYENGELVLVCGHRKEGKSMFSQNETEHKLKMGKAVLTIDSEMSTRRHFERMIAHLTQIDVRKLRKANTTVFSQPQKEAISKAIDWMKLVKYRHIYMPSTDMGKIYSIVKKMRINNELDFLVYDYLKSQGSSSASEIYNMLGDQCNFLKNRIAGELDIPVLGLAQLSRSGDIGDSYKLEQFASVTANLKRKTVEEIHRDGKECGNYKLFVKLNRLGEQMSDINEEYVDLYFNGNMATFEQASKQHEMVKPY